MLLGSLLLASAPARAQEPRSIADCRAIEGELARFACYEALEDPGAAAQAPAAQAPAAPAAPAAAAPVTPARPVSNLPVVRRPSLQVGDLTGDAAAAPAGEQAASGAEVREQEEEKPGLLRRLLPFGGDDDAEEEAPAAAAPAAPATATGDADVDSFGLASDSARVETDDKGRKELVDTVASVRTLNQNLVEVTLQSGQVWRQMLTKRYPINVGDSVVIRPSRWGSSYRLTSERISGFIQVERVK